MAAYRALQPKLTDVERERLNRSSFRSRFSLVLVLSAKYDVPVPASFKEFTSFIFEMLYPTVHDPMTRFGAASYSALSEDDKKRFIAAAADILLLPDVDRRTRYDFLNSQPEHVAAAIEQLTRRNPPAEQTLVNILYYKQNPDAAPAELRASLDVFDPITMLENIHRQPSPPSPDRPSIDNPPPPPDRRRPPPPSGRPQDLGGPPSPRRER